MAGQSVGGGGGVGQGVAGGGQQGWGNAPSNFHPMNSGYNSSAQPPSMAQPQFYQNPQPYYGGSQQNYGGMRGYQPQQFNSQQGGMGPLFQRLAQMYGPQLASVVGQPQQQSMTQMAPMGSVQQAAPQTPPNQPSQSTPQTSGSMYLNNMTLPSLTQGQQTGLTPSINGGAAPSSWYDQTAAQRASAGQADPGTTSFFDQQVANGWQPGQPIDWTKNSAFSSFTPPTQ